jgi:hypothetical protein
VRTQEDAMPPLLSLSVILAVAAGAQAGPQETPPAAAPRWTVREVPLCPGAEFVAGATADLKRVACAIKQGKQWQLDVDGQKSALFKLDIMKFSGVRFTDDGRRFAYVVKDDGRWRVVVDGAEVAGSRGARWWQEASIGFQFTEDGRRWFFLAGRGADAVGIGGAMAGPVGALVGALLSKRPGYVFVVDGDTVAEDVRNVLLSRDGGRFGYVVSRPDATGGSAPTLVVRERDGTESQHAGVSCEADSHCAFSPDGAHLAYSARRDGGWVVVADNAQGRAYEAVGPPSFSPDSRRLAHPAKLSGRWMVVTDGVAGPAYDQVASPSAFSRDGARTAYAAQRNGKWLVVLDGTEGEPYEEVGSLYFSPDGKRLAYAGKRADKWSVVEPAAVGRPYDRVYAPVFSADGARMAYGARREGKVFAVIDGREDPAYDDMGPPAFSPGGEHLVYAGKRDGKWRIVVDGADLGVYRLEGERRILFDGPARFYALTREKQQILRLEGELQP